MSVWLTPDATEEPTAQQSDEDTHVTSVRKLPAVVVGEVTTAQEVPFHLSISV
jgi:hypothetical protein